MLPLKQLPKILKHAHPPTANGHLSPSPANRHIRPTQGLHSPSQSYDSADVSQSSQLSELETEEKELRERLVVLEEQKFMVEEMVRDAQRRRKFEEVASLGRNLEDLSREVDVVRGQLEEVARGFGELYGDADGSTVRGSDRSMNGVVSGLGKGKAREGMG